MNIRYEKYKEKLNKEMKKKGLVLEDLIPIDWFHLHKHASVSYVIKHLTWAHVEEICQIKKMTSRRNAPLELLRAFISFEKDKVVSHAFPMTDYASFISLDGKSYEVCCMPTKTLYDGFTKFIITHYKEVKQYG